MFALSNAPEAPPDRPTGTGAARPDAVVIGSGVGGSMAAHALMEGGMKVLMIERGVHVERGRHNWAPEAAFELSPYFSMESHYRVRGDGRGRKGTFQCVGGPALFYGGVALRLRSSDFGTRAEITGPSGASWPISYDDLAPHYKSAEGLLGVAGRTQANPADPADEVAYPRRAPDFSGPARLVSDAAARLGLRPTHLPLAIDFDGTVSAGTEGRCVRCDTCDGYICAVGAKRDPAAAVLGGLVERGLALVSNTVAVRILWSGRRVAGVVCVDRRSRRRRVFSAERYILAGGALGSPHLVLASGLEAASPARDWIGRCLMRHASTIVYGLFRSPLPGGGVFHKQVGIFDHYGHSQDEPNLGHVQSIHPPPPGLLTRKLPRPLRPPLGPLLRRCTGLLAITEDQPRRENRIELSRSRSDRYGLPRATITHRYSRRDQAARRELAAVARAVLREAGAIVAPAYRIRTFSHAAGTLRMGPDPATAPLDRWCRLRGTDNLWVVDGSFMPRSGAVNPSLTIAANALRVGGAVAGVDAAGPTAAQAAASSPNQDAPAAGAVRAECAA